jgi:predicted MFS family arabinose efflux permease
VVGLPASQFLGNLLGRRLTFSAAATLLVVVAQTVIRPGIPPDGRSHLLDLLGAVTQRAARSGMVAGALVFIGQFTTWKYSARPRNRGSRVGGECHELQ